MSEIIFGIYLGGLLLLLCVVIWRTTAFKGEDREPTTFKSRLLASSFITLMLALGIGMFVFSCDLAREYIHQHEMSNLLRERGHQETVPLIEVRVWDGKKPTYEAAYEYNGARHRQSITKDQYNALKNQTEVEILAYGEMSQIADTQPQHDLLLAVILMPIFGAALMLLPLASCVYHIRIIFASRKSKRKKHKPAKMKKRAPEEL